MFEGRRTGKAKSMGAVDRILTIIVTATITSMVWIVAGGSLLDLSTSDSQIEKTSPAQAAKQPEPITKENFRSLLENSPFQRILDFKKTYALRGIAKVDDQSVAWLYNRHKKKTVTVREDEANDLGMTLVAVNQDPNDLQGVSVEVRIGNEAIELNYESDRLAPRPQAARKYAVDRAGRAIPPQGLIDKFRKMNREQMAIYQRWRADMVKKDPKMDKSAERFPHIEKAMDAILRGRQPARF